MSANQEFGEAANGHIVTKIKEELARRRMSRQSLAEAARISMSTLEKTLSRQRPITLATLVKLEAALGVQFRNRPGDPVPAAPATQVAPLAMGSYSRSAVQWIEGRYLTYRPSFADSMAIYVYITQIFWDEAADHLGFYESQRADSWFAQTGHVTVSSLSGHIYLVTNSEGQYRTATLSRSSNPLGLMGILSTLAMTQGPHGSPIACPLVLKRIDDEEQPHMGTFAPGDEQFGTYRETLDFALAENFARFAK